MDSTVTGVTMPDSEMGNTPYKTHSHIRDTGTSDLSFHHSQSRTTPASYYRAGYYSTSQAHFGGVGEACSGSEYSGMLQNEMSHDFPAVAGEYNVFAGPGMNSPFPNIVEEPDFAATFPNFQPCDDCTPATKTAIPHHHHPSGRLAGASATLDGHFCCSWLVHGQPCFLCFESAEALDNHIKNDHAGKDGTYRCLWQNCSKHDNTTNTAGAMNFGNKPKLMRHVHSHTGYKPFPCPYPGCEKAFVTKEQLRNHETTHTKSRKYKCDQCGKAFAVKSALTTHITAVHEEKKIHSCDICGKAFADSSNLSKHKQTHYRDNSAKKQRTRRATSNATSTRSSPSMSTPSIETTTPIIGIPIIHELSIPPMSPGLMAPPMVPQLTIPKAYIDVPITYSSISTMSTTSSPPPESFDPNCYCCDHCPPGGPATPCDEADDCDLGGFCCDERCTPPNGLVAPCTDPEDCDLEGFCDSPECLEQTGFATTVSSSEASMSNYHCNEPLLHHHQIEQLRNFQVPLHWTAAGATNGYEASRLVSHRELEEQFTNMHGS